MITDAQLDDLNNINLILNAVAAVFALSVVALILIATAIDRKAMDRLSIRFTLAISFVDFLKAIVILGSTQIKEDGPVCVLAAFSMHWLLLIYIFLNVVIAVNLQLVFVHGITFNPRWERHYWLTCLVASLAIMGLPLVFSKLGMEPTGTCGIIGASSLETYYWVWFCCLLWILLGCVYCFVVVVLTIINLRRNSSILDRIIGCYSSDSHGTTESSKASELKAKIKSLTYRVSLYCIIPVATHLGFVWLQIQLFHTGDVNVYLAYFSIITSDLPGILNFLVLLVDPSFINATVSLRKLVSSNHPPTTYDDSDPWLRSFKTTTKMTEASVLSPHLNSNETRLGRIKRLFDFSNRCQPNYLDSKKAQDERKRVRNDPSTSYDQQGEEYQDAIQMNHLAYNIDIDNSLNCQRNHQSKLSVIDLSDQIFFSTSRDLPHPPTSSASRSTLTQEENAEALIRFL